MMTASTPAQELPTDIGVQSNRKRIPGIDLAETLAMLMVVVYHISLCSYQFLDDPAPTAAINFYLRTFMTTCAPLFFMANGFLLLPHKLNLKKHIWKTIRLCVISVLWGIAPLAIQLSMEGTSLSPVEFFETILGCHGATIHLWYMAALVCMYIFFPLIKVAFDRDKRIFLFFIAFTAFFTFGNRFLDQLQTVIDALFGNTYYGESADKWVSIFNPYNETLGYTYVYFCVGGLIPELQTWLQKHISQTRKKRIAALTATLIAGSIIHAVWFAFIYIKGNWYMCPVWFGYKTVSGFIMTTSLMLLCMEYQGRHSGVNRTLQAVSENSMGVYFLHMICLLPLKPFIQANLQWLCNLLGNVLIGLAVTAVCVLVSMLIKKVPGLRWLLR